MAARFRFIPQALREVLLIEHPVFGDARGRFTEVFRASEFEEAGIPPLVQENASRSVRGVLRGLHFQEAPRAQGKLVRCVHGRIFDVAVDIRPGSPTFARWVAAELDDERPTMLWIPAGFAHGFCVLSDSADVVYKQSDYYSPEHERSIRWDDPTIAVRWPIVAPVLSEKDAHAPSLTELVAQQRSSK